MEDRTPLSGARNRAAGVANSKARRSVPTPGSTTTTWMDPVGKNRWLVPRTKAAWRVSCGRILVGEIDEGGGRVNVEDYPFHHADVGVGGAEIGGQNDGRGVHGLTLLCW